MFSIFKRKSNHAPIDLSAVKVDMHSHLLPGIDDGATDPANSAELIKGLREFGLEQFVTTPHVMWDMYKNTPESIGLAHERLKAAEPGTMPIRFAAEYFMDDHFESLLESKASLLTIFDNYVLFEFSFVNPPMNWKEILFNLQLNGYRPVLAHPERYSYMASQRHLYDELKSHGCLFQLNILSLTGYYNKTTAELAAHLLHHHMIDLVGTDLHHTRHLQALAHAGHVQSHLDKLLDSGRLLNPTFLQ